MAEALRSDTRGKLVAALLAGAWRPDTSASDCSLEELELLTPLVMETGAGALAWRRVRHSELKATPAAQQLHDAYRLYKLRAVIYEREVAEIFRLLRSHSIEPILVKGWAIAKHYAEPETRPCGDIDLCVSKEQFAAAQAVLKSCAGRPHTFDLHREFRHLDDRSFDELAARSELVELEGALVRVLSAEDHLRVLCYHFLREGGWRALWLCDISVALESRPASFDWDLCLSGNRRRDNWVACSIGLAHQLLGAEMSGTPVAVRDAKLPAWLLPSILREWEVRSMSLRHRTPMSSAISQPLRTLKGLRHHWPTPVEATVTLGASFNELPRLPFQVGNFLSRAATLLARLPRALRNEH
ncbi:MAG TPA: nucleotidyltransferase family protein [Pyrinomonadaceae bacterium]